MKTLGFVWRVLVFQLPQGASRLPEGATLFIGFERVVALHCRRALELAGVARSGGSQRNRGLPWPTPAAPHGNPSEARDVTNANAAHKDVSAARGIATTRRRNSHFKKVSLLSGDVSSGDNRGSLILINPTPAVSWQELHADVSFSKALENLMLSFAAIALSSSSVTWAVIVLIVVELLIGYRFFISSILPRICANS
jgi:hypothetical protein